MRGNHNWKPKRRYNVALILQTALAGVMMVTGLTILALLLVAAGA